MPSTAVITQTQNEFLEDMPNPAVDVSKKSGSDSKTEVPKGRKKYDADSLYGVARYVPNKMLVAARQANGNKKTSIECVLGQMKMFKESMDEARRKRERENDENHEVAVAKWGALLPQPNWSELLGKKKRRITKTHVYVENKKKKVIQEELDELAAGYYEYDKWIVEDVCCLSYRTKLVDCY